MEADATLVVTISRQIGAGGAYVGQALARRLGIRYVDREILQKAAALLGRDEGELAPLEERVANMWDRVASILSLGTPEAPFVPPPLPKLNEEELFDTESGVMREIAAREDAVFVGRGASWVLRDHPGVVRVFLHAPESWRIERIRESYGVPDVAAARQLVESTDRQRSRFVRSVAGRSWTSPDLYDISINTASIGLDVATDLLAAVVSRRRTAARP